MIDDDIAERRALIGEYVLGLLEGQDAETVRGWITTDPEAARMALQWETDLLPLAARVPAMTPSPEVWARLRQSIATAQRHADGPEGAAASSAPAAAASPRPRTYPWRPASADAHGSPLARLWRSATAWRWLSAGFATALLLLTVLPDRGTPPGTNVTQVAVLQAPGEAAKPGWVLTVQGDGNVRIDPLVDVDTPSDRTVQLWTLAPGEKRPRSLGLVAANAPITVAAADVGAIQAGQLFELTLEPSGGSPTGLPTGPILFLGRVVAASAAMSGAGR